MELYFEIFKWATTIHKIRIIDSKSLEKLSFKPWLIGSFKRNKIAIYLNFVTHYERELRYWRNTFTFRMYEFDKFWILRLAI